MSKVRDESSASLERLAVEDPILHRSLTQYDKAHYDSRYSSVILLDGQEIAHLLMCCHCRQHFLNVRIPGQPRGWCMKCNAPVCPKPACDVCVPFERWLESVEKSLPLDQLPIRVAVHGTHLLSKPAKQPTSTTANKSTAAPCQDGKADIIVVGD